MKHTCYSCGKSLANPGAMITSPPIKNNQNMSVMTVHEYHICLACWPDLLKHIDEQEEAKKKHGHKE